MWTPPANPLIIWRSAVELIDGEVPSMIQWGVWMCVHVINSKLILAACGYHMYIPILPQSYHLLLVCPEWCVAWLLCSHAIVNILSACCRWWSAILSITCVGVDGGAVRVCCSLRRSHGVRGLWIGLAPWWHCWQHPVLRGVDYWTNWQDPEYWQAQSWIPFVPWISFIQVNCAGVNAVM